MSSLSKISKCVIVVRISGRVGLSKDVEDTLKLIHLTRTNHATILTSSPSQLGMLQKVKDHVTWGEGTPETVTFLIRGRGEFVGGIKLTDESLNERSSFKSVDDLAEALCAGDIALKDIKGLKPLFRLRPPRGGFRGSRKKAFVTGGEVGYRGEAIADLLSNMV